MSIATIAVPPPAVYHEEQHFGAWAYAATSALIVAGAWLILAAFHRAPIPHLPGPRSLGLPVGLIVGGVLPAALMVGALRMTTEVRLGQLRVWFGVVPSYRRAVDLASVRVVEVVRYRPWRDCGGFGIRLSRDGERVLNARGDRGVRLTFADGSRLLVGSQRPEALAAAVQDGMCRVA